MKRNWEYKKLGEVCDSLTGLWTGKKEPFVNVAVIRNTNFSKDCKLKLDDVAYLDVEQKQYSTRKLLPGDIIVEKSGGSDKQPVGRVVLFDIPKGDFSFSNFTGTLRIKNKRELNSRFLHHCLFAHYLRGETRKLQSKTTGLHNLDMKGYLKLPIPVPPLEEQSRIVAELDLLTGIIDKQNAQLKELDSLAQAIFYDMFGDPIENPKGWDVKNLGAVCDFKNGLNFAPDETGEKYYLIGVSDFQTKSRLECDETLKTIELSKPLGEEYLLADDDILFVRSNGNKDLIARNVLVTTNGLNVTYSGFCIRARVKNDDVIPFFLNSLLKLPSAHNALTASGHGCNIANLNQKTLDGFQLILPPHSLQQSFAEKIQSIEKQKESIRASIADTQKLLDCTMDKYFG